MLWLILGLVLYGLYKIYQIITWLHEFHAAVIAQFIKCGCPTEPTWPPKSPPAWP